MSREESFIFAGFGGQGIMFAGQLLAYAAMDAGFNVTWIPSYGPEMRGGTANCCVVISPKPIGSPIVQRPAVSLVFNAPSFQKFEPVTAPGGLLVVNASLITLRSARRDVQEVALPATDTASTLGSLQLTNMVLLGAALALRPVLPLAAIAAALDAHLPAHRRGLLPMNIEALARGAVMAEEAAAMQMAHGA